MYCGHCGQEIPDNSKFCPRCGQGVVASPNAAAGGAAGTDGQGPRAPHMAARVTAPVDTSVVNIPVIVTLVGALLMLISVFMPLYVASLWGMGYKLTYFNAGSVGVDSEGTVMFAVFGVIILVAAVATALLRFKGKKVPAIVISVVMLVFGIFMYIVCRNAVSESYGLAEMGSSSTLLIVGAIVAIVGGVLKR